jgi:hypothetical protein
MGVGCQGHVPADLPPRDRVTVLFVQEAGSAPGPVWTGVEKRKSLLPIGVWTPNRPAFSESL